MNELALTRPLKRAEDIDHGRSLVARIAEDPLCERLRAELAVFLDQFQPSSVELHKMPNWVRLAWIHKAPKKLRTHYDGRLRTNSFAIADDFARLLNEKWDHWGQTRLLDEVCLVSEPYVTEKMIAKLFRPIAQIVGCIDLYSSFGEWLYGTRRVILFPAPTDWEKVLCDRTNLC